MGIYDRDYYRDTGSNFWDRVGQFRVTTWLIAISVVIFLLQLLSGNPRVAADPFQEQGLFDTDRVMRGEIWRFITAIFVQQDQNLFRLIFGMLFLYWLGNELESTYYPGRRFLAFYVGSGIVVHLAILLGALLLEKPYRGGGNSLPVMALLMLFTLHFPHQPIRLFFVLSMPIWVLAAGIYVLSALSAMSRQSPIELMAVVAAGLCGFLYFRARVFRSEGTSSREDRQEEYYGYTEPERDEPIPTKPSGPHPGYDEELEAKLDAVLDKVSRQGRSSLTAEENAVLMRASQVLKRRNS